MKAENAQEIQQRENVDKAFSAQAPNFDDYEKHNPILQWMRTMFYRHLSEFIHKGDSILDINAGTGIDAMHFARLGHAVTAIDVAGGMVDMLKKKLERASLTNLVSVQQCSFTDLSPIHPKKFHHVISNFGGLNCVADLHPVADQIRQVLSPLGTVTLVIMPSICPWEIAHALKGNFFLAFRRLRRNGVLAHVEGHYFKTYYHSPASVIRSFGNDFNVRKLRGLGTFTPPPYMDKFARRRPRLYSFLTALDESFSLIPPLNRWADHFIITLQYQPSV